MPRALRPNRPIDPQRFPFYYGWMIVIAATLCMASAVPGSPPGISPFVEPMLEAFSLDRASFSLAYGLATLLTGIATGVIGSRLDHLDIRKVCMVTYLIFAGSLIYLGFADRWYRSMPETLQTTAVAWAMVFGGFFVMRVTGMGIASTLCRSMIARWFSERRSLAVTISGAVISFTFSGAPAIFFYLVDFLGWRETWIAIGVTLGIALIGITYVFFRKSPEECDMPIEGLSGINADLNSQVQIGSEKRFPVFRDIPANHALQTLTFWAFIFGISLNAMYGTGASFHITSMVEAAGLEANRAPELLLLMGIVNVGAALLWGVVGQRISLKIPLTVLYSGIAGSIYGAMNLESWWGQLLFSTGAGISWGSFAILLNLPWPRYFGRTHLGSINARVSGFVISTGAVGPYLFGLSKEFFGSYILALLLCLALVPIGVAVGFSSRNPQEKFSSGSENRGD